MAPSYGYWYLFLSARYGPFLKTYVLWYRTFCNTDKRAIVQTTAGWARFYFADFAKSPPPLFHLFLTHHFPHSSQHNCSSQIGREMCKTNFLIKIAPSLAATLQRIGHYADQTPAVKLADFCPFILPCQQTLLIRHNPVTFCTLYTVHFCAQIHQRVEKRMYDKISNSFFHKSTRP
jgi:hypothetical protein